MAHTTPAYLARSRHGIFYFRISVPPALRAGVGTREIKHSLKTRERRTAMQLARRYATHYDSLFATLQEHPVTYLEMKALLQDAKTALLDDLKSQLDTDGPLPQAERAKVRGELRVLRTFVASEDYTPRAQALADSVLANAHRVLPPTSPAYRTFCVEATKMLDALLQAYLAHSAALDGYTAPEKPASTPAQPNLPCPLRSRRPRLRRPRQG